MTEISADIIAEAHEKLITARIKLLFNHPFFGQLALRLTLTPADPNWCPTAATDGRKFYYNPLFVLSLDDEENVFLVAHELGHCVFEHFLRINGRNPKLWNIAGDYMINNILDTEVVKSKKGNYARVITTIKIYLDHKYDGWTTEEVYEDIEKEKKAGGNPEGRGELVDTHIDMSGGSGDPSDEQPGEGLAGRPSGTIPENERKQLQNDMRDALIQATQTVGAGNVPGDMKRLIQNLTEPKMDWREILRARIESSIKSDYSWMRVSRKGWHMSAILPGMTTDFMVDIVLAIDTSGSISTLMLQDFVSEVAGIMDQYPEYRIRIWQFDTGVYGYEEFTHDDGKELTDYEIKGGGGTKFEANWDFMKERGIEPDQFIMFTDGQPGYSWGDPDYCDTVFLVHTKYGKPVSPFGETVYFPETRA